MVVMVMVVPVGGNVVPFCDNKGGHRNSGGIVVFIPGLDTLGKSKNKSSYYNNKGYKKEKRKEGKYKIKHCMYPFGGVNSYALYCITNKYAFQGRETKINKCLPLFEKRNGKNFTPRLQ